MAVPKPPARHDGLIGFCANQSSIWTLHLMNHSSRSHEPRSPAVHTGPLHMAHPNERLYDQNPGHRDHGAAIAPDYLLVCSAHRSFDAISAPFRRMKMRRL